MKRALSWVCVCAGLLGLGLWAWLSLNTRITAEGGLAVGEPDLGFRQQLAAVWQGSEPPRFELYAADAQGGIELSVDGQRHTVAPGEKLQLDGAELEVLAVLPAPQFILQAEEQGRVLHQGIFKVSADPEGAAFFMIDVLPHRFYVRTAASGADDRFDLAIYRGKLRLADREVGYGEAVPVGKASFLLEPGVSWVRFEARRRLAWLWSSPGALFWVVGLGLLARRD